jgi:hypothetical protein
VIGPDAPGSGRGFAFARFDGEWDSATAVKALPHALAKSAAPR